MVSCVDLPQLLYGSNIDVELDSRVSVDRRHSLFVVYSVRGSDAVVEIYDFLYFRS